MENQTAYDRIAAAIEFISENFRQQPGLDEVAAHVHLSPYHFQRLFTQWAGTSPKKFLQYISLDHARKVLRQNENNSVFDAAFETGLSGTGRLHDLFVNLEGMTPGEYKNGGINLKINYSFGKSPFGPLILASTSKGICRMAFWDDRETALNGLMKSFPNAEFLQKRDDFQRSALAAFETGINDNMRIRLHVKGTPFQLKVWESLLKVPAGRLVTYSEIAGCAGNPNAARVAGSAIGKNPVAWLIPCHRVIQSTGHFGGYMWGSTRKKLILARESASVSRL